MAVWPGRLRYETVDEASLTLCMKVSLTGVNPRVTVTRIQAASERRKLTAPTQTPAFGGLTDGVATLTISQNSTGPEVAEAIRSAAVVKDEISMRRFMLVGS